jgi:two-component system sensor histidine kinase KdpD
LAICRAAVEAHGGKIRVDESEGGGATFRFTLPLGDSEAAAERIATGSAAVDRS